MPSSPLFASAGDSSLDWLAFPTELWTGKLEWYSQHVPATWLLISTFGILALVFGAKIYFSRIKAPAPHLHITQPPFNLSAAAIRYVLNKGMDSKTPVISMVNAAIMGCYRISWRATGFLAERNPDADFTLVHEEERDAFTYAKNLYWQKVHFSQLPNGVTKRMSARLEQNLSIQYRKLFRKNWGWLAIGIGLSLIALFVGYTHQASPEIVKWFLAYTSIFCLTIVLPLLLLLQVLKDKYWFGIGYALVFMSIGLWALAYIETRPGTPFFSAGFIPLTLLHFIAAKKLPQYTAQGRTVMQSLLAYRLYLKSQFDGVAEGQIPMSQVVHHMPYALALDLDYGFTRYFDPLLGKTQYEPYQIFNTIYGNN
jgi:hypothetical protein